MNEHVVAAVARLNEPIALLRVVLDAAPRQAARLRQAPAGQARAHPARYARRPRTPARRSHSAGSTCRPSDGDWHSVKGCAADRQLLLRGGLLGRVLRRSLGAACIGSARPESVRPCVGKQKRPLASRAKRRRAHAPAAAAAAAAAARSAGRGEGPLSASALDASSLSAACILARAASRPSLETCHRRGHAPQNTQAGEARSRLAA